MHYFCDALFLWNRQVGNWYRPIFPYISLVRWMSNIHAAQAHNMHFLSRNASHTNMHVWMYVYSDANNTLFSLSYANIVFYCVRKHVMLWIVHRTRSRSPPTRCPSSLCVGIEPLARITVPPLILCGTICWHSYAGKPQVNAAAVPHGVRATHLHDMLAPDLRPMHNGD